MESFVKSKFNIAFISTFFSVNFAFAGEGSDKSFVSIKNISNAYLKSFGFNEEDGDVLPIQAARDRQKKVDYSTVKPPVMDDVILRRTIFDIYENSPRTTEFVRNNSSVLNKFAWNDLKLFYGTTSDLQFSLLSRINNTKTTIGECALAVLLATPTADIEELMARQEVINSFLTMDVVRDNVNHYIELYKKIEQSFISFWSKTDPIYNQAYNDFLVKKFFFKNKRFNNSKFFLEAYKRIKYDLFSIALPFIDQPLIAGFFFGGMSDQTRFFPFVLSNVPVVSSVLSFTNFNGKVSLFDKLFSIGGSMINLLRIYNSIENLKEDKNLLKSLALRLNDVKTFLFVITKIENIITSNESLNSTLGNKIVAIRNLIELGNNGKTGLGRFLKTLKSLPLYDMNFFFNNTGKLLACFNFFVNNKHLFDDAIYELGQIDAFFSIADLIKKSTNYNDVHTYNFTKFLNKKMSNSTPYLNIKEMWNPFLDSRIAIGNNIEFGENSASGLKTMILTGPNAGGKSTFIVGLGISILLSQVFGIAPADEFILTPFGKVNSYIEVRDDISTGKSLFMAEVDRVQSHIDILDNLKPNEYSFTIFDEPFRGTNPYEGAAVEYSVLEALSKYKNTFNIVATHYPMIMLLEEKKHELGFRNYKVFISRDPEKNDIIYHFKIVPGRATQSIAIDILEKYGYAPELLARAKDIVNNPTKYEAGF